MASVTETRITPVGNYFTARDAFKAIKCNGVINIVSYVNITTQIPANTAFADIGLSSSNVVYGMLGIQKTDGSKLYPACIGSNKKLAVGDTAVPAGYYYIIGTLILKR
jgi:hypothetical protein